jgi:hypothetical protein
MKTALIALLAIFVVGCGSSNYEATTAIGATRIIARLHHAHPYLAEYKKDVEILYPGMAPVRKELLMDSGGYSWITLYKSNNELIIQDFGPDSIVVDLSTGATSVLPSLKKQSEGYLGRFDFDKASKDRLYRFIGANEQAFDADRQSKG